METNKTKTLWLGIIIGIMACTIIGLVSFIIYDKVLSNNENNNPIENNQQQPNNKEEQDVEQSIVCNDCITQIVLPTTFADQKTTEGKIVLGNKIRNLKVTIGSDGEHGYSSVSVDNKILKKIYFDSGSIDKVFVFKEELLMIVTAGSYVRSSEYFFYNTELQEINTNFTIDSEYPNSMKSTEDTGEHLTVENNIISVIASRSGMGEEIDLENGESTRICDYDLYGTDGVEHIKGTYEQHKGEIVKARYEIEYLGNGKFKSNRVEILQRVDESFCN